MPVAKKTTPAKKKITKKTTESSIPEILANVKGSDSLLAQYVRVYLANQRQGTKSAKTRAEVIGSTRKIYRQKGTGRARHGSIRSPIWKGGGVTHGPLTEKNFKKKINKKMARRALFTVLSAKVRDGEIILLDDLHMNQAKTKEAALMFGTLAKVKDFAGITKKHNGALLLLEKQNPVIKRAVHNLPYVKLDEVRNINALEVLQYKYVLFTKQSVAGLK